MDKSTIARFWEKVNKHGPIHPLLGTRCWLWSGGTICHGYGYFWLDGKNERAHRVSWLIANRKWPDLLILHHCNMHNCVRPSHLFEGTHQDNMDDMVQKQRVKSPVGSKHGMAKLTEQDVLAIRQKYAVGDVLQRQLASEYGVSRPRISHIISGTNWKHV